MDGSNRPVFDLFFAAILDYPGLRGTGREEQVVSTSNQPNPAVFFCIPGYMYFMRNPR